MSRACTICTNPQRDAIDAAIRARDPYQAIAARYGVTRDSVRRHALSHMGESTQPKRTKTPKRVSLPSLTVTRAEGKRPQGQHIPDGERADYQERFLEEYRSHGILTRACDELGISRMTVRAWEEHDTEFSLRYSEAREAVNDLYREAARRRAIDGEPSYVVNQGKLVYDPETGQPLIERKYSDALLQFVMKAKMPEYREQSKVDVTSNGQTVGQGVTLDQLAALMAQNQQSMTQWEREHGYEHDDLDAH